MYVHTIYIYIYAYYYYTVLCILLLYYIYTYICILLLYYVVSITILYACMYIHVVSIRAPSGGPTALWSWRRQRQGNTIMTQPIPCRFDIHIDHVCMYVQCEIVHTKAYEIVYLYGEIQAERATQKAAALKLLYYIPYTIYYILYTIYHMLRTFYVILYNILLLYICYSSIHCLQTIRLQETHKKQRFFLSAFSFLPWPLRTSKTTTAGSDGIISEGLGAGHEGNQQIIINITMNIQQQYYYYYYYYYFYYQ